MEAKLKLFKELSEIIRGCLFLMFGFPRSDKNQIKRTVEDIGKLHELLYDFEKELVFIRADGGKVYELCIVKPEMRFMTEVEAREYVQKPNFALHFAIDFQSAIEMNLIKEVKREVEEPKEPKEEKFDAAKYWDNNSLILSSLISRDEFIELQKKCEQNIEIRKKTNPLIQQIIDMQCAYNIQRIMYEHLEKEKSKRKYMEGTEWRVCKNCKFFREAHFPIIAPIKNIIAYGICQNANHAAQPVVLDSKTDTCNYFIFK
jgi:hypothetical protein